MKTTLNAIREHSPCASGWTKLLKTLNKTSADGDEVTIEQILDSNGLDDALWCLRAVSGRDKEIRLFAVWCARQVQHLMTDERSLKALDVAEAFANGNATEDELQDARTAAWTAARYAAGSAARYAAGSAWYAAGSAARYAAKCAVEAASELEQEKELRRICLKCAEGATA
jgi:hypothetical protein